jgi:hypothetical protein
MSTTKLTANGGRAVRTEPAAHPAPALAALLIVSAFSPFIYLLSWQPALSDALGNDIAAAAILLASLMLGLSLGSFAVGALWMRCELPPLRLIAAIAMASGAMGLAPLPIFAALGVLGGSAGLPAIAVSAALAQVLVSGAGLGACVALGFETMRGRSRRVGPAVGRGLCFRNAGAGAVCLAGLLLMRWPALDLADAVCLAAALNAAIAGAALVIHRRVQPAPGGTAKPVASSSRKPMLGFAPLLWLAGALGFLALSYLVFFFRAALYASGSSGIALAATLGTFLLGLASGAEQAGRNCAVLTRDGATRRAIGALMKANLTGVLFLPLVDHLAWLERGLIGFVLLSIYLAGRYWGALLPYLAELGIVGDEAAGRRFAWLGSAFDVGAAVGAAATGMALAAGLSLGATAALLVVTGLTCAALLVSALAVPRWEKMLRAGLAGALGVLAIAVIPLGSAHGLDRLQGLGAGRELLPEANSR